MSKLVTTLGCGVLILLSSAIAQPLAWQTSQEIKHGGKIETKYDGISFETVMRLRKMRVTCGGVIKDSQKNSCVSIEVALHCPGTQVNHVGHVTVQLTFETRDWSEGHPPDQRDLAVVVDAETVRVGRMRLLPKADTPWSESTSETLEATLSYDLFKKMIQSQSVEMQVGRSTVALKENNRAAMRDLNSRVLTQ